MPAILIADSEPLQRLLIRETLSPDPTLTFLEAEDGGTVLVLAQKRRPDLIILDSHLPFLDECEVYIQLRIIPNLRRIPVIFITTVLHFGSVDGPVITKPFEPERFQAVVREVLDHAVCNSHAMLG